MNELRWARSVYPFNVQYRFHQARALLVAVLADCFIVRFCLVLFRSL